MRERALRNPVRRGILRWLHRDFEPHHVDELCSGLSLGASEAEYHRDVLEGQRIVKQFEGPHGLLIESRTGDDPDVIAVLLSTQADDRSTRLG